VVGKIEHRPLDYPKLWRIAQGKTHKPVKFGTCSSQVMALFLDIHTDEYRDKREVIWDMAEAMNKELLALRDAGCRCIQIEEPTFHFMANTYGKDHDELKFMIAAFNREVQGLDDVELWIHTCWGNPCMQRVMEDTSYANSIEIYLEQCRGDVWTLEMKDRNQRDLELFEPFKNDLKKKICIGAVSHRSLQADTPEAVAGQIRSALKYIPAEKLIVSSDCGFGRQGCSREIAFYKASAIAQGCNIVRGELGLPEMPVPAANPILQLDVVPGRQSPARAI
jgi:5-methyltetrahydropteroyltriglutamate--homocysteine methyltransferase